MRIRRITTATLLVVLLAPPAAAGVLVPILTAEFNDKTPGDTIGTGAAAVGEPVSYTNLEPIVRLGGNPSPYLAISDIPQAWGGDLRFEWLNGIAVSDSALFFRCDVNLRVRDDYAIVFESSAGWNALALGFASFDQHIYWNGTDLGPYQVDQTQILTVDFYFGPKTFNVILGGVPLLTAEPFTGPDIASVTFSIGGTLIRGEIDIDNLSVQAYEKDTFTSVGEGQSLPFFPLSAQPNPFRERTTLSYRMAGTEVDELRIYDVAGRLVRTLGGTGRGGAAVRTIEWDGRDDSGRFLPSGVYFYRPSAGNAGTAGKLTLLR